MSDFVDPYLDPETGILRNLIGAITDEDLAEAEREISYASEFIADEIPHTKDFEEFKSIHRALFGEIYDWAGEIRTVDIQKPGHEFFLVKSLINQAADFVFNELKSENYLQNLETEIFTKRLAYFFDQLNYIHPFREGNGRTQRIFWSRIANDAGYELEWFEIIGDELNSACIEASENQNLEPLEKIFSKISRGI